MISPIIYASILFGLLAAGALGAAGVRSVFALLLGAIIAAGIGWSAIQAL